MKYKGVELEELTGTEFSIGVQFNKELNEDVLNKKIFKAVRGNGLKLGIENVIDGYLLLRSEGVIGFSFDKSGVLNLSKIYHILKNIELEVYIDVYLDDFTEDEYGELDSNNFQNTWEEFLENIEY